MEEQTDQQLSAADVRHMWFNELITSENRNGTIDHNYLTRAAVDMYWQIYPKGCDNSVLSIHALNINEWLERVLHLHAVTCVECRAVWTSGFSGRYAESQDEARVGAHANGWQVTGDNILCHKCKEGGQDEQTIRR